MEKPKCNLKIEPDPILGWKVLATGDCSKELSFLGDVPPGRRRYLERRLKLVEPEPESE